MSIENTNTIDFISIGKKSGVVNLTLVDATNWNDECQHLMLLQDKINEYLRFIESGEIDQTYPKAIGRYRSINIVAQYEPTKAGFEFISLVKSLVEGAGFRFRFDLRSDLTSTEYD